MSASNDDNCCHIIFINDKIYLFFSLVGVSVFNALNLNARKVARDLISLEEQLEENGPENSTWVTLTLADCLQDAHQDAQSIVSDTRLIVIPRIRELHYDESALVFFAK